MRVYSEKVRRYFIKYNTIYAAMLHTRQSRGFAFAKQIDVAI